MNFDGLTFLTALILFDQSDYSIYSHKDSDWLIVACFVRVQGMLTTLLTLKKWGNTRLRLVFLSTMLSSSSRFLSALQQNRAQSRLFYMLIIGLYIHLLSHLYLQIKEMKLISGEILR